MVQMVIPITWKIDFKILAQQSIIKKKLLPCSQFSCDGLILSCEEPFKIYMQQ